MRVFCISGISGSGKTTTLERVVTELRRRGYSVGTVKDIHFEAFAIDIEGTNTYRHRQAGAQLVTAWGLSETDVLFQERLPLTQVLKFYNHDFVIIEGIVEAPMPKILTAFNTDQLDERFDSLVFAVSGRIADEIDQYRDIPAISTMTSTEQLVSLIEEKVYPLLPNFPEECCGKCGANCTELASLILSGDAKWEDCVVAAGTKKVKLSLNGQEVPMVPFVQSILFNAVQGVVRELDGYEKGVKAEITIERI